MRFVFEPDSLDVREEADVAMLGIWDARRDPPCYLHFQHDKAVRERYVELNSQRYCMYDGIDKVILLPDRLIMDFAADRVERMNGISTVEAHLHLLRDRYDELRDYLQEMYDECVIVDR